mgnify:CR=1 FL=1
MSSGVPRKVRIGLARVRPITVRRMDAESRMYTEQAMPLRTLLPSPAPKYWDMTIPIPAESPRNREKSR